MFGSFVSALSGLKAAGTAIDVIGNDLANLNTTGFKSSTLSFQDVVADVTGAPWIEIDFPNDVSRAADEVLPQLRPIAN